LGRKHYHGRNPKVKTLGYIENTLQFQWDKKSLILVTLWILGLMQNINNKGYLKKIAFVVYIKIKITSQY
jgi:hypothetical protein